MICVKYTVPHKQQIEKFEMDDNSPGENNKGWRENGWTEQKDKPIDTTFLRSPVVLE